MSNIAFAIETARHAAGVAVAEGQGFRFYAAHPLFRSLEGQRFSTLAAMERAAYEQETTTQEQNQDPSRRQGQARREARL
jgi:hypothetical protein